MILNRLGNKRRIAHKIIPHFPQHDIYIEMFFGAGGMFFAKPQAKHNFVNDSDGDVYNFWKVIRHRKDEFIEAFLQMPIHNDLFQFWRKNKETDELMQAVRFLFLSNFGFKGKSETLKYEARKEKEIVLQRIEKTLALIQNVRFMNCDFRKVLDIIQFHNREASSFVYADPPYFGSTNNYKNGFTEKDTTDLFEMLVDSNIRFAISEFDNPMVLNLAERHHLNVIEVGERQNLGNRRTEILITNYKI